jgi:hypothetical protein
LALKISPFSAWCCYIQYNNSLRRGNGRRRYTVDYLSRPFDIDMLGYYYYLVLKPLISVYVIHSLEYIFRRKCSTFHQFNFCGYTNQVATQVLFPLQFILPSCFLFRFHYRLVEYIEPYLFWNFYVGSLQDVLLLSNIIVCKHMLELAVRDFEPCNLVSASKLCKGSWN